MADLLQQRIPCIAANATVQHSRPKAGIRRRQRTRARRPGESHGGSTAGTTDSSTAPTTAHDQPKIGASSLPEWKSQNAASTSSTLSSPLLSASIRPKAETASASVVPMPRSH